LEGLVPIQKLVLSKELRKTYASENQPHVAVKKKIAERKPGSEPKSGDRVEFIVLDTGNDKHKLFEKAEDPQYAIENNLKVDSKYYLEHGVINAMESFFKLFTDDVKKMLFQNIMLEYDAKKKGQQTMKTFMPEIENPIVEEDIKKKTITKPKKTIRKKKETGTKGQMSMMEFMEKNKDITIVLDL